jgi:hypothetical protein
MIGSTLMGPMGLMGPYKPCVCKWQLHLKEYRVGRSHTSHKPHKPHPRLICGVVRGFAGISQSRVSFCQSAFKREWSGKNPASTRVTPQMMISHACGQGVG